MFQGIKGLSGYENSKRNVDLPSWLNYEAEHAIY